MKKFLIVLAVAATVAGCDFQLPSITTPVNSTNLYEGETVFDAALKVFNKGKDLCARRVIASSCRTYVIKGQKLIINIASADQAARNLVDNGAATIDITNAVQTFTALVSTFDSTATSLSKL